MCSNCQVGTINSHGFCEDCGFNELQFIAEWEEWKASMEDPQFIAEWEEWKDGIHSEAA
jgi:hypothetical protein